MTLSVQLVGGDKVILKMQSLPGRMKTELNIAMQRITIQLVRYVQANKLSGQVLKRRTGTLSRSISQHVDVSDASVTGVVDSRAGGQPLAYAAFHEYGFTGTQSVRQYLRKTKNGNEATVHAYARRVNYPAHSFLRSSLAENQSMIQTELNAAVAKVAHE